MELTKTKYKKTEVGLIPEDWNLEKIGQFAKITTGSKDTQDRVEDGLYPFYVRSNTVERINSYSFDGEAILTSGDGVGVGKIFHYLNCKFDYHQRVYNIYDYRFDVYGKFLYYYFSTNFYNRVMSMTAKSSVDSVRREMIADMLVPLPPTLEEQKAIANALSDVDALIANLEKLIEKKKAIKQGAMQQLLTPPNKGGKRLAGFSGEWEYSSFESLCKIFTKQTGFDYSAYIKPSLTQSQTEDSLPFIQNKDFKDKVFNFNTDYFIPKEVAVKFPKILLDEKCLLISISGSIGNVGVFQNERMAFIGGAIAIAKLKDKDLLDWVLYYLNSTEGQNKLFGNVKSGSHQNLILDDIRKIQIPLPSKEERFIITGFLDDIEKQLHVLIAKLEKYNKIKQGMMQELLTGKTRLI